MTLKILIADDHALFRAGLKHILGQMSAELVVFEADDFDQALASLSKANGLDLALIDMMMPGMEGALGLQRICDAANDVPIVVVSAKERTEDVHRAIECGAMGYVPKSSIPEIMINALHLVLSGGLYLPPNILGVSGQQNASTNTQGSERLSQLTARQRDVLALLAEGRSNKEIADELGITAGTVKLHMTRIFRALNVSNRTQAVIAASDMVRAPGDEPN